MISLIVMLGLPTSVAFGQAETIAGVVVGGATLDTVFKGLMERVRDLLEQAVQDGAYLEEKALRGVAILLQNLEQILEDQQGTLWENLADNTQIAVRSLGDAIDRAGDLKDDVLELEDFLVLDLQSLINELPFAADEYLLRKVEGYSQAYQGSGMYEYRLIGNAFQPQRRVSATVGSYQIPPELMYTGERANVLRFQVPSERLKFDTQNSRRVPVSILVYDQSELPFLSRILPWNWGDKKEKAIFKFEDEFLLLPIEAATYTLNEHVKSTQSAGNPSWSGWGDTVTIPRLGYSYTGNEECPPCRKIKCRDVCVRVPSGKLVQPLVVDRWEDGDAWGRFCGEPFIRDSGNQVCWQYRNWRRRYDHKARIRAQYYPMIDAVAPESRDLKILGEPERVTALHFQTTYEIIFSEGYQSFDLSVRFFNGATVDVTPATNTSPQLISAQLEAKPDFHRLTVRLLNPW